jgi:hypothetical protein
MNFNYDYLNPTAACHTNANNKKSIGITGRISTIGLKIAKASGNLASKISVMKKIDFKN